MRNRFCVPTSLSRSVEDNAITSPLANLFLAKMPAFERAPTSCAAATTRSGPAGRPFVTRLLLCLVLGSAGCTPSAYKAPAEEFLAGTRSLREIYFAEWDIANKARIQRADLDDQVVIWTAPPAVANGTEIARLRERMAKRRTEDVHDQLRPLREQAFAVLEGYGSTILGLASDESTESLVSELNGLAGDVQATVRAAGQLKLAADAAARAASFLGPLQSYVQVVNELVRGISSVLREQAIHETIGRSNRPIVDLLNVLKTEALLAKARAESELKAARHRADSFVRHPAFADMAPNVKTTLARDAAKLDALAARYAAVDIDGAFTSALQAQQALVEAAVIGNIEDLRRRMQTFQVQVEKVRQTISQIRESN